ncbi:MAG: extracellular solute-binding protein [Gammaproteobacteria bacterium]|nr:extracellular solute-binding protein [Gammaproteobacteria bacterium]MDE0451330.1 extracellular solute-binding protein [Gammaproteobacteria bacterium]
MFRFRARAAASIAGPGLLALCTHQAAAAGVDYDALEFRHGISQIPNYELKYPEDFAHLDYVNPAAPKGGALSLAYTYSMVSATPTSKPPGFGLSYDYLLERAGDELSGYYGSLAESVALSADRRSIVFRLRPEARWHDGKPITSTDVKFSLDTFRQDFMASGWGGVLDWIVGVEAPGPLTVAVHGDSDVAKQVHIMGFIPIVPEHYWVERDVTQPTHEPPLQSGPYRMTRTSRGRYFEYSRVPDYWGRDLPINRGRFNFDTIRYERHLDGVVAREALRAGMIDVWTESDSRHWLFSYDVPAVERGWLRKGTLGSGAVRGARWRLALNTQRKPFDDPLVREALAHAFDFEWQNRALHGGERRRAHSYFADSMFASSGLPDAGELALLEPYRALLPDAVFNRDFSFPRSEGIGVDRRGLSRARQLLADAGYRMQGNVLADTSGEPFTIEFLCASPVHMRTLLPYVNALTVLGIQASIGMVETVSLTNRRRSGDFDALILQGFMAVPPSWQLRPYFHSAADTYWNPSGIDHPAVDALVDAALGATDLDVFVSALRALDRVLLWHYYQLPIDVLDDTRIVYWDKFGRPDQPDEMFIAPFPDGWWFDEEKARRIDAGR